MTVTSMIIRFISVSPSCARSASATTQRMRRPLSRALRVEPKRVLGYAAMAHLLSRHPIRSVKVRPCQKLRSLSVQGMELARRKRTRGSATADARSLASLWLEWLRPFQFCSQRGTRAPPLASLGLDSDLPSAGDVRRSSRLYVFRPYELAFTVTEPKIGRDLLWRLRP